MFHQSKPNRTYDPDTIAVMRMAFDQASLGLFPRMTDNEDVKHALATVILRLVDQGERAR